MVKGIDASSVLVCMIPPEYASLEYSVVTNKASNMPDLASLSLHQLLCASLRSTFRF